MIDRINYKHIPLYSIISATLLFLIVSVLFSCGGGTTGTGGTGSTQFEGRILAPNGDPVARATISILESGDSAESDAQGGFSIETQLETSQVTFLVEKDLSQGSAQVDDISPDTVKVAIDLEFDAQEQSLRVTSRSDTRATPTPKPQKPTPKPSPHPTVSGTIEPTTVPTISQNGEPTPIGNPTEGPATAPTNTATPTVTETPTVSPSPTPTVISSPEFTATATVAPTPVSRKSSYIGSIIASPKTLLRGARIQVTGSGIAKLSSSGKFSLSTLVTKSDVILTVLAAKSSVSIKLSDIPPVPVLVKLAAKLSLESSKPDVPISRKLKLELLSIDIREIGKAPTPIPTPKDS